MFDDLLGNDNDADNSIEYIKYVSIDMIDDFLGRNPRMDLIVVFLIIFLKTRRMVDTP